MNGKILNIGCIEMEVKLHCASGRYTDLGFNYIHNWASSLPQIIIIILLQCIPL